MNPLCAVVWVLAIALIPLLILQRVIETPEQKIKRLYQSGSISQRRLAERFRITTYKVRKILAAT